MNWPVLDFKIEISEKKKLKDNRNILNNKQILLTFWRKTALFCPTKHA